MTATRDTVIPDGRWRFDDAVTAAFDDMLARSIPEHDRMRELAADLAGRFVRPGASVIDLGTSRGEALARLNPSCHGDTRFVGVEVSPPMLAAARDRFDGYGNVTVLEHDLRGGVPDVDPAPSVILSVLTLMFTPIEHRLRLVDEIRQRLTVGGVFVVVEKVLGATGALDGLFVDAYYDAKRAQGYTDEQIDRKRLALEGVLVPVTAAWNEQMLRSAGFAQVDCFWRSLNFAGWLAVR